MDRDLFTSFVPHPPQWGPSVAHTIPITSISLSPRPCEGVRARECGCPPPPATFHGTSGDLKTGLQDTSQKSLATLPLHGLSSLLKALGFEGRRHKTAGHLVQPKAELCLSKSIEASGFRRVPHCLGLYFLTQYCSIARHVTHFALLCGIQGLHLDGLSSLQLSGAKQGPLWSVFGRETSEECPQGHGTQAEGHPWTSLALIQLQMDGTWHPPTHPCSSACS